MPAVSVRTVILISCAVLLAYLAVLKIEPPEGGLAHHRFLSDDDDRRIYQERAKFYTEGRTMYREVFSEYPTLATLAFAAPYLLPGGSVEMTRDAYLFRWSCLMAAVYGLTIALVATFRRHLGFSVAPALLMLGPSALYFGLMRFDILCACLLCVSLAAFARGRYVLAHVVLGIATFVKWYPAVVFPVYLAFHWSQTQDATTGPQVMRQTVRHVARYAAAYVVTILVLVGVTVASVTWDGFMVPYRYHGDRGSQYFNPYWLIDWYRPALGLSDTVWMWIGRIFIALELLIVPILLFVRVRTMTDVFRYSVLAIYLFITFSRVDSPQWILWYLPVVLMFARNTSTLVAVCVLTVVNYLVFPVGYDHVAGVRAFSAIVFVKDLVLLALIGLVFRDRAD